MEEIERLKLTVCPHCGEKMWYIEAFVAKNQQIYRCKSCKRVSKVKISREAFGILVAVQITAIIVFAASVFIGGSFCLWGIGFITAIFGVFYTFSPFMVKLIRLKKKPPGDNAFMNFKKESGKDTEIEIYSN